MLQVKGAIDILGKSFPSLFNASSHDHNYLFIVLKYESEIQISGQPRGIRYAKTDMDVL